MQEKRRATIDREKLERISEESKQKGRHSRARIIPPTLEDFEKVARDTKGRIGKIAEVFSVSPDTIYKWRDEEPGFREALNTPREMVADKLEATAELLAFGIPDIDPETKQFRGWIVQPSEQALFRLMKVYGMHRGFGDNPQEVNINLKEGSIPIKKWLTLNTEAPQQTGEEGDTDA